MVRMMPRIEAGETLSAINRAALTNGATHESDLDRMRAFEELRLKAAGAPPPAPAKADPSDLAGMGIGIANAGDMPTIDNLQEWLGNG